MGKKLVSLALSTLMCVFYSCHEDADIPLEFQKNTVTWEILASDENASLRAHISNLGEFESVSSGKKYTFKTEDWGSTCRVTCEDYNTNLTIKGFVNGKLKKEVEGKQYLQVSIKTKGE